LGLLCCRRAAGLALLSHGMLCWGCCLALGLLCWGWGWACCSLPKRDDGAALLMRG
jgi:hypothetical protein